MKNFIINIRIFVNGRGEGVDIKLSDNVAARGFFPLYFRNIRVAMIPSDFLKILIEESKKALGSTAAESLAYHLGVITGRKFYEMMVEAIDDPNVNNVAEYFTKFMSEFGWGKLRGIEIKDEYIFVTIGDLFECAIQCTDAPASRFTNGFIEGLISRLLGSRVVVKEVECVATGADYCVFKIFPLK